MARVGLANVDYGCGIPMSDIMNKLISQVDATMDELIKDHQLAQVSSQSEYPLEGTSEEIKEIERDNKALHSKATSTFHQPGKN